MERYRKGIIAGGTGLLYQAAEILEQSGRVEKIELYFCNGNGFGKKQKDTMLCRRIAEKKELMELLIQETENTLVLSVMNPWLFTAEVLQNPRLLVVNLHHALLPAHRGRNAEAWTVYEGDAKAGITWHKVDAQIDRGAIYLQKEVATDSSMTSLKLLSLLNKEALSGLRELLSEGFQERAPLYEESDGGKLHLAKDVPNDGWLDLSWDPEQMSRFLRAMDYGILQVMGRPKVRLEEGVYTWKSWQMRKREEKGREQIKFDPETKEIQIYKEETKIVLKQIEKMEDEKHGTEINGDFK